MASKKKSTKKAKPAKAKAPICKRKGPDGKACGVENQPGAEFCHHCGATF